MIMRVDNVYSAYKPYITNGVGRQRRANAPDGQIRDSFSLSVQAADYQLAHQAISQLPAVRQDKVDTLRLQIEADQYSVSPAMVADRILQNTVY